MIKRILFALTILLTFTGCPKSDDDANMSNNTSIVGEWKPIKDVDVCSENDQDVFVFSSCMQQGRFIFLEDGSYTSTDYEVVNGCELINTITGRWELNENSLTLFSENESQILTYFELSNNTLQLGVYDTDPNSPCNGTGYYYLEFRRIE